MSRKKYKTNILQKNQRAGLYILTWASECGSQTTTGHHPNPKEVAQTPTADSLWIPVLFMLLIECLEND
ncbi:hypothetical protein ACOSP7_022245 [Xanthoceras sorbifolium]